MILLNYERLKRISLSEKPYRGSANRFPIGGRRDSRKYFLVEQENGETVFKIVYWYAYDRMEITKDEATALDKVGKNFYFYSSENRYFKWVRKPNVFGTVRSDNTFEFTAQSYGQGVRRFLSTASYGYFFNDSRRGGMVYRESVGGSQRMLPIYKGMRVRCGTMEPTKPITIVGKAVDRKASKKLMAKHQDFFKVAETMCKAMTLESWLDTAKDIYLEHETIIKKADKPPAVKSPALLKLAEEMKASSPLDAVVLYALGMNIDGFRWKVKNPSTWHSHKDAIDMFNTMKAMLCKQIYKENEDTFKTVTYEMGEVYPPSEWGYTLVVDGVEVNQYGYGV